MAILEFKKPLPDISDDGKYLSLKEVCKYLRQCSHNSIYLL